METLILTASPSPSPIPAPIAAATGINWSDMVQKIITAISATTANPVMAMVGVGVVTLLGVIVYLVFKVKINEWLKRIAQIATGKGKEDFVDNNTPTNQDNTNADNDNRGKLGKTKKKRKR